MWLYLLGGSASISYLGNSIAKRHWVGPPPTNPAEHYALIKTAEGSTWSFQDGMIQMAADKNNVKKKINQIKGCT